MWNRDSSAPSPNTDPVGASRPGEERRVIVWVGKSVIFKGELVSSEDMSIDGRVEGTIEVRDHSLTIGPDADIRADITAKAITIHGAIKGTVTASDKVEIRETGSVTGDIRAPRVSMADGALVHGHIDTWQVTEGRLIVAT